LEPFDCLPGQAPRTGQGRDTRESGASDWACGARTCSPAQAGAQNCPVRSSGPRPTAGNTIWGQGASHPPFVSSEVETPAKPPPPHPQTLAMPAKGEARQGTRRAIQRTKNASTA